MVSLICSSPRDAALSVVAVDVVVIVESPRRLSGAPIDPWRELVARSLTAACTTVVRAETCARAWPCATARTASFGGAVPSALRRRARALFRALLRRALF